MSVFDSFLIFFSVILLIFFTQEISNIKGHQSDKTKIHIQDVDPSKFQENITNHKEIYSDVPFKQSAQFQVDTQILNITNPSYFKFIQDSELFTIQSHAKSIYKIWSSAYVKIKSDKACEISEGSNIKEIEKARDDLGSMLFRMISRFNKNSNEDSCDFEIFVPIFKRHYIRVDIPHGILDVKYSFTTIDYRLVSLCAFGLVLYCTAEYLARNETFHFASGVSIGLVGSILILVFIVSRLMPKKSIAAFAFLTGTSTFMFIAKWLYFNFQEMTDTVKLCLIGYFALSGLISMVFIYIQGPVTNPRHLKVIEYTLRFLALVFIYLGCSFKEIFLSLFAGFVLSNLAYKIMNMTFVKKVNLMLFPVKRKLLTQDEYMREADEYTQQQLRELQKYCRSPDCNSWRIITRLKSPERFAKFIENQESHVSDEEASFYERYNISNDLIDEDL